MAASSAVRGEPLGARALQALFALILTAAVEALHRLGLPRSVSAILVMALLVSLIGVSLNLPWTAAQNWWASAPQTLKTVERKVRPVSRHVAAVAASHLALATIEGQTVQPLAGIVIAVPRPVSLKVVAANSKHGQPVLEFLSPEESKPSPLLAPTDTRGWREVVSGVGPGRIPGSGR